MVLLETILSKCGIGEAPEPPAYPALGAAAERHRIACLEHLAAARAAIGIAEACLADAPLDDAAFASADAALAHKLAGAQIELRLFHERRECMGEA